MARGHWQWVVPVGTALGRAGYDVELWTHRCAKAWAPESFNRVRTDLGEGDEFRRFVASYKAAVSAGDSVTEGYRLALSNGCEGLVASLKANGFALDSGFPDPFELASTKDGREAFRKRLGSSDSLVEAVIYERCWTHWVEAVANEAKVPSFGIMPSFFCESRAKRKRTKPNRKHIRN